MTTATLAEGVRSPEARAAAAGSISSISILMGAGFSVAEATLSADSGQRQQQSVAITEVVGAA